MKEAETASKDASIASKELEEAAAQMQRDMPPTLAAMEDASREVEEVGEAISAILTPFTGVPSKPAAKRGQARREAVAEERQEATASDSDDDALQAQERARMISRQLVTAVRSHHLTLHSLSSRICAFAASSTERQALNRQWGACRQAIRPAATCPSRCSTTCPAISSH